MKRIISRKRIKNYVSRFPTAEPSLMHWFKTVRRAQWKNSADLKATYRKVDPVTVASRRTVYVFDIEHNRHRLIAAIHFNTQAVYILRIMPHQDYDRDRWKDEL